MNYASIQSKLTRLCLIHVNVGRLYISYRPLFVLRITIYVIAKIWILFLDDLYLFCLLECCIPAPAPSFPPLHRKIITCRNRYIADIWLTCMCDLDFKLFSSSRSNLEYVTVLTSILCNYQNSLATVSHRFQWNFFCGYILTHLIKNGC